METLTLKKLEKYGDYIEGIFNDYARINYVNAEITNTPIVDRDRHHFLLVSEGWEGKKRVHRTLVHLEIRDDKIWIHFDGMAESVVEQLLTLGVPKEDIVLAFHPPHVRKLGDFAIA
ncbi:XisI protein [Roseofilum sp. BLCC_M154]|uniref:XisI protein n=1 Tax=Roseofilum acuticapitatum BLCC-M154 TaxID=3022444 RepID=A0ABT7AYM8_9CYAN|nr:XisI protein [Roseofilum acuticapitatum]MDJ1172007.1 XisI protein [Roseofilum acuticapitatum BLCC-M154]